MTKKKTDEPNITTDMTLVTKKQIANAKAANEMFSEKLAKAAEVVDRVPVNKEMLEDNSERANAAAKILAAMKKKMTDMTKPFRDGADEVRSWWKGPIDRVEQVVNKIRANNKIFTDELARQIREQEEKARRIEEGRRKAQATREAKGMKVKPIEELAPVAAPVALRDQVSIRMVRTHQMELVDFFKVPAEFLKDGWQEAALDKVKIKSAQAERDKDILKAKKDNKPEPEPLVIPGLKLWTEEKPY